MRRIIGLTAIVGMAALVGACGVVDYKNKQVTGSDYDRELYSGYSALADAEWNEADATDGNAFGSRAVAAAQGARPGPELISARKLPADKVDELTQSRAQLIAALNKGAADKMPKDAADAQVSFDCWMQEQEENIQPDDIAKCRAGFETAMARLDAGMKEPVTRAMAPALAPTPAPKLETTKFVVYFDFDSATLNNNAKTAISIIKGEVKPNAKVMINAFADRAGSTEYNDILAAKRAKTIYSALEAAGIKGDLQTVVYGEEPTAVPTKDGVPEKLNRRVEISVTQ